MKTRVESFVEGRMSITGLPTPEDLPVDFGRYFLQRLIGSGGSAHVYLGELRGPGGFCKSVALKLMRPNASISNQPDETHMLVREARLGGLVRHPNVVDIYELGVTEGQPFISMELVAGPSLRDLYRPMARYPLALRCIWHCSSPAVWQRHMGFIPQSPPRPWFIVISSPKTS